MADPVVAIQGVTNIRATSATLNATITANATDVLFVSGGGGGGGGPFTTVTATDSQYFFQIVTGEDDVTPWDFPRYVGTYLPADEYTLISGSTPTAVTRELLGLKEGTLYQVRFCAARVFVPTIPVGDTTESPASFYRSNQLVYLFPTPVISFKTLG